MSHKAKAASGWENYFLGRVTEAYPPFGGMSTDARLSLLLSNLSDDTPKEIDNVLYRFLIQLFASRERGLAPGPAGSRFSCLKEGKPCGLAPAPRNASARDVSE